MNSHMHRQAPPSGIEARHSRRACRRGFSLLEVVLALTIFLGAFIALSDLSSSGMTAAVQARMQTKAILRCESKLAELAAAVEPLEDVTDQPFEDDPKWSWSLVTIPGPHADLLLLNVTIQYDGESEMSDTAFAMSQLIRDPVVFEPPPEEEDTEGDY